MNRLFLILSFLIHLNSIAQTTYLNRNNEFEPFYSATDSSLIISNTSSDTIYETIPTHINCQDFKFSSYVANINNNPTKKYKLIDNNGKSRFIRQPGWGIIAKSENNKALKILVQAKESSDWEYTCHDILEITILGPDNKILRQTSLPRTKVAIDTSPNSITLQRKGNRLSVSIGEKYEKEIWTDTFDNFNISEIGYIVPPCGKIDVKRIIISISQNRKDKLVSEWDNATIISYLAQSIDPNEGYWKYLDRSMDENLLRLGGDYTFALIKSNDNEYNLIYLNGAKTNSNEWSTGMIKARLFTTQFNDVLAVEWYDSQMLPMNHEITAQIEGDFIKIVFPYQNSHIRLHRIKPIRNFRSLINSHSY